VFNCTPITSQLRSNNTPLTNQWLLRARPAALEETHENIGSLSQLLIELAPHITHKPALSPLAGALTSFLQALPVVRGEELMRHEEVMLRAITRARHEAETADMLEAAAAEAAMAETP